ncbi:MAG: hypothetical protein AB7P97_20350 [Hyphomonadaceae bacterium]
MKLSALIGALNVKSAAALEAAKIAGRLALALAKAKLIANFRKWNRGDTGKQDDEKPDTRGR